MRIHKNLGHPSKELLCRALRIGGASRVVLRSASERKCDVCMENKLPESHLPAKLADTYTEFNQGGGVDLFVLPGSDEQVLEFLKQCRSRNGFTICCPVPPKRPDDVLSVLEMVCINWAGPMHNLISDMEVNSRMNTVSLWKCTAFDTISRQPKPRGKTDLSNVMVGGVPCHAVIATWSTSEERSKETRPTREEHSLPIGGTELSSWSEKRETTCSCLIADA